MMSDFDKFFAEKLGEEGQFPRRGKNWRALSKRLDAFDTGLQHHSGHIRRYLRYWQAVAACTIVAAAWLTWKVATLQSDNAGLRREMAALQEKNMAAGQETALSKKNLPDRQPSALAPAAGVEKSKNPTAPSTPAGDNEQPVHAGNLLIGKRNSSRPLAARSGKHEPASADRFVAKTTSHEKNLPSGAPDNITDITTDSTAARVAALAILPHRIAYTPDSSLQSIAASQPVEFQKSPPLPPPDSVAASAAPKVIQPARNPSRLRAGIQLLTGIPMPHEKGISLLTGHGINAEYKIWRNFWLTGSADWLRYDISTEKYIPKFHSHHHDPPPQGGSQEKLVKVESTQRQQQFALGLRYSLPVRSWIRPAVRVAYTTTRTSPELTTFKFEHQGQGGPGGQQPPKYKIQKSDSRIIGNIWRFGAGLEHETQRWAFGLWADYSKNFAASDLTFDALQLRAGIQYTFN